MSQKSAIEWTESTWNPWMGCTKVSPGCAHCYMFRDQERYGNDPTKVRRSKTRFNDPLKWKTPLMIFTCSWSDWFHEDADQWRDEAWDVIRQTPHHTYQILTKRPERIVAHLPSDWGTGWPNVWLGVSVENQRHVFRALMLAAIPAAVRFVSAEPLLGAVDLQPTFDSMRKLASECAEPIECAHGYDVCPICDASPIHWVIAGGESGDGCRPMDVDWVRSLRDQCQAAEVAFFYKQEGGWPDKKGGESAILDGRRWLEMPKMATAP